MTVTVNIIYMFVELTVRCGLLDLCKNVCSSFISTYYIAIILLHMQINVRRIIEFILTTFFWLFPQSIYSTV